MPPWAWLAAIVLCSIAVRVALARRIVAPWILIDELVRAELAKSFAEEGRFLIRDVPAVFYAPLYPILIAPAWRLFPAIPDAYAAAKAINAVVMSLAAVPAYLLARRLLTPRHALLVAGLTVLVPSMLYTGTLMSENAFYPLFLLVALMLVVTLERPTPGWQLALLAVCGLAVATRLQALAVLAAVATAPPLLALVEGRGLRRGLRPFATLYALLGLAAAVALAIVIARGGSPANVLGAYSSAVHDDYEAGRVIRFSLYHVGELSLYLGVVPFAALVALWLAPRSRRPAVRAFTVASLALGFWMVAVVAVFASQPSVDKIAERNMFYVAPLALTALVALAVGAASRPRRWVMVAAAAAAALLPLLVPFERFLVTSATADTFGLLPWWWLVDRGLAAAAVHWVVLAVGIAAGALFVLLPRRLGLLLPALVGAYFLATTVVVENGRHGIHNASLGKLWEGILVEDPDWVDRAVGRDAVVAVLWTARTNDAALWQNEFFSRSVGPVYGVAAMPSWLPATPATRSPDGRLIAAEGPVEPEYVLAERSLDVAGELLAEDPRVRMRLYRVERPLRLLTRLIGIYPGDTWSGSTVTYVRADCPGGRLSVTIASDPALHRDDQPVVARVRGRVVGRARVPPSAPARLEVPLTPGPDGSCRVRFDVPRAAVPKRVVPGSTDERTLGVHFRQLDFTPSNGGEGGAARAPGDV